MYSLRLALLFAIVGSVLMLSSSGVADAADLSTRIPNGRHFSNLLSDSGEPQTQFEADFRKEGQKWTTSLCTLDSDGDGLTNGDELGDPCCIWKEANTARRTIAGNVTTFDTRILSNPGDAASTAQWATCRATNGAGSVSFSDISFSSLKVNWPVPSEVDACICRFRLEMSTGQGFQTLAQLPHTQGSFTKANLRADSEYSFRLSVMSADQTWGPSVEGTARTLVDPLQGGVGENCQGAATPWDSIKSQLIVNGDDITIPSNVHALLDVPLLSAKTLNIVGCLTVSQSHDVTIAAEAIVVTGKLEIGTATNRYTRNAVIELLGNETPDSGKGFGNKVLTVRANGVLSLHGVKHAATWARLADTVLVGSSSLTLDTDITWPVGAEIVLASTDYDMNQAERVKIISTSGRTVQFSPATRFRHFSGSTTFAERTIEERGEVGLLSHNIIIRGDESSVETHFGGHTMFFESAGRIQIDSVEFTRMGQRGILGRYPCHFHLYEHARGSYVRSSSIHDTLQRAFVLHAVHELEVSWNVVYNIPGHAYFLEDGIEMGNIIEHNLGLVIKPISDAHRLLFPRNFDTQPTVFWMTNPNNTLRYNAAAGSHGHGIWYQLEPFPTGPSATPYVRPEQWAFGEFKANVAHSNGARGLNMWHDFFPRAKPLNDGSHEDNPYVPVYIYDLTSYKNRGEGYFAYVMGDVRLVNARFAGNGIGFTFNHEQAPEAVIEGALIVGDSANVGLEAKNSMVGVQFPRNDRLIIRDVAFAGFRSRLNPAIQRYAIDFKNTQKFVAVPGNCVVEKLQFESGVIAIRHFLHTGDMPLSSSADTADDDFAVSPISTLESAIYHDGYRSAIVTDNDGSLSGTPGAQVIAPNRLMIDGAKCAPMDGNMYKCTGTSFGQFFMQTEALTNSVDTVDMRTVTGGFIGIGEYLKGKSTKTGEWEYRINLLDDPSRGYKLNFTGKAGTPEQFQFNIVRSAGGAASTPITLVFYNRSPLKLTITDTSSGGSGDAVVLGPDSAVGGGHVYDCLKNELQLTLSKTATITTRDALKSDIPEGVECVPFLNGTCPGNCGGSSRGRCQTDQTCACKWGWWGDSCEKFHCAHVKWCNGNGECVGPNQCQCYPEFQGRDCRDQEQFEFMRRTLAFGDIHVRTFDNHNYTFNSRGDFYFVKSAAMTVQARLVGCDASGTTSCTQRIAFKSGTDTVVLESQASGSSDVTVKINNIITDLSKTRENLDTPPDASYEVPDDVNAFTVDIAGQQDPETGIIGLAKGDDVTPPKGVQSTRYVLAAGNTIARTVLPTSNVAEYTISFAPHAEVKVWSDGVGFLGVSFSVAASLTGTTAGLYGTFDSNPENDFIPRGKTVPVAMNNPTAIHAEFGESWRVPEAESYFTYTAPDVSYAVANPELDIGNLAYLDGTLPEGTEIVKKARKTCSRIGLTGAFYDACVYDIVATSNVNFALGAAKAGASDTCAENPSACAQETCPSFCSLNGRCEGTKCSCDFGWRGDDCGTRGLTDWYIVLFVGVALLIVILIVITCWWCRREPKDPPEAWKPRPRKEEKVDPRVNPLHVMGETQFSRKLADVTYLKPDESYSSGSGDGYYSGDSSEVSSASYSSDE